MERHLVLLFFFQRLWRTLAVGRRRSLLGAKESVTAGEAAACVFDCGGRSKCGRADGFAALFHARDGGDRVERGDSIAIAALRDKNLDKI